jgi:hypothetical protein
MLTRLRIKDEAGNVLVTVVLVSMLIGALASLALRTGSQADSASASDRNHTVALGVAEAGVHQAIARIEQMVGTTYIDDDDVDFTGSVDEGDFVVDVNRVGEGFEIDARSTVGPPRLERTRHIKVTLLPPRLFPDSGYALFSSTNLYLKNNNEIYAGDIWANDSLWVESGAFIEGSVTSAQSWVMLEQGTNVTGYVWSGGRKCTNQQPDGSCTEGWAITQEGPNTDTGANIAKWAKSSVSAPSCESEPTTYKVIIGGRVQGDVTTPGAIEETGTISGAKNAGPAYCSTAPARKNAPVFSFNRSNYDPDTLYEFGNAAAFQTWLTEERKDALEGTFVVTECGTDRIDISGSVIVGDVTVITNPEPCPGQDYLTGARVYADNITDDVPGDEKATFIIVSHHRPGEGAICTDSDDVDCAISAKNQFDAGCRTAALIYADNGPVAMKNDLDSCGSVIAAGIQMKNNLELTYDPVFDRVLGFGLTFEVARWEELPA